MPLTWDELTVDFSTHAPDDLRGDWRWLAGDGTQLILVSALGDMFLGDARGRIFWLDVGQGRLQQIAASQDEFRRLMQEPDNVRQWFVPALIGDLVAAGRRLTRGQCYSYKIPPVLGGELAPANLEPTDLSVHFSVLGQIHRQLVDKPPGTRISGTTIE